MADELNIPTHRWYQKRNHVALAKEDVSRQYIYDSGIQKIDAWINSQPWGVGSLFAYAANGITPQLVADFKDGTYGKASALSTFDGVLDHSRAGNATMVDADGVLKWAPHNLLTYSEDFRNTADAGETRPWSHTNVTIDSNTVADLDGLLSADTLTDDAVSGAHTVRTPNFAGTNRRTVAVFAKAGSASFLQILYSNTSTAGAYATVVFDLSTASVSQQGTGASGTIFGQPEIVSVGNGWFRCSVDLQVVVISSVIFSIAPSASGNSFGPTGYITYSGIGDTIHIWGAHLYRSDLGGMAAVPEASRVAGSSTYVPTTDAAKYLPRVGHHIWDGSEWVNEGLLHESDARTNLLTYSEDFSTWSLFDAGDTLTAAAAASPDGATNAYLFAPDVDYGGHILRYNFSFAALTYTLSAFVKASGRRYCHLAIGGKTLGTPSYDYRRGVFDLQDGVVVSEPIDGAAQMESFGDGWYRCSATITVLAADSANFDIAHASPADPTSNVISDGNSTDGIYIYGAQLEEGSTPSSYIPTAGATVTRAADAMTIPAANLPWPTPNVIGEELVTNGTFDTDLTGWTSLVNATWDAGEINCANGQFQQISVFTGSKTVRISWDQTVNAGSRSRLRLRNATGSFDVGPFNYYSGSGPKSIEITTTAGLSLWFFVEAADDINFDNISVREINPLAVSIAMRGRMTYADTGGLVGEPYRWLFDSSNNIVPYWESPGASTGRILFRQRSGGVLDVVTSGDVINPGINVPYNIASRHGSTFINGAVDGTALTADLTPTALPYLENTDMQVAPTFNGTIKLFRMWADDLTDAGIEEASA